MKKQNKKQTQNKNNIAYAILINGEDYYLYSDVYIKDYNLDFQSSPNFIIINALISDGTQSKFILGKDANVQINQVEVNHYMGDVDDENNDQ